MDFSALKEAVASKSYDKIADICDDPLLQVATEGANFQEEWPYAIHVLSHIYLNDVNNARFLWKSILNAIKESKLEVVAAWKIGQHLWKHDYAAVHEAIRGYEWTPEVQGLVMALSENYTMRIFQLLTSAYSTISIADAAHFLGMSEDDVTNYALQHGWSVDPAASMFTVKKQHVVKENHHLPFVCQ